MTTGRDAVLRMLGLTREQEVDCGTFTSLLAPMLEGLATDEEHALIEHHKQVCPECAEELEILRRALG